MGSRGCAKYLIPGALTHRLGRHDNPTLEEPVLGDDSASLVVMAMRLPALQITSAFCFLKYIF